MKLVTIAVLIANQARELGLNSETTHKHANSAAWCSVAGVQMQDLREPRAAFAIHREGNLELTCTVGVVYGCCLS